MRLLRAQKYGMLILAILMAVYAIVRLIETAQLLSGDTKVARQNFVAFTFTSLFLAISTYFAGIWELGDDSALGTYKVTIQVRSK